MKLFSKKRQEKFEIWVCDKFGGFASRIATFETAKGAEEYADYKNSVNDDITIEYTVIHNI